MSAGRTIERAHSHLEGVTGALILALTAKRPVPARTIKDWVDRLRRAADELETLL